jgi:hypothetical protein
MFSTKNWIYLGLIVSALAVFIPRSAAQTISCSSEDGKRHYCSANGPGRARLVNQRSESACTEGYSWGSDDRGIWVDHGCRADFAIEERRGGDRDHDRDGRPMTAIGTRMGIETTTTDPARDKSSRAHRMTCTGTIAQLTRAAACN